MKQDLTTLGEAMVRVSVRPGETFAAAVQADLHTGGCEANAAVAAARLGLRAAWVSRLPDNPLGRRVASDVARHGVDVSGVIWTQQDRVGTYFVEFAAPPGTSQVTYDRAGSAFAKVSPRELPWEFLLDTRVLHLSGITAALSPGCLRSVQAAREKAREKKVPVSFDVNYRSRLWGAPAAGRALAKLVREVAVLVMTREDAAALFKISGEPEQVARQAWDNFRCGTAVITCGRDGAWAYDGKRAAMVPGYSRIDAIDRVGAGDTFVGAFLGEWLDGKLDKALEMGVAASALKMGMRGDQFLGSREQVEDLISNRAGGIKR